MTKIQNFLKFAAKIQESIQNYYVSWKKCYKDIQKRPSSFVSSRTIQFYLKDRPVLKLDGRKMIAEVLIFEFNFDDYFESFERFCDIAEK